MSPAVNEALRNKLYAQAVEMLERIGREGAPGQVPGLCAELAMRIRAAEAGVDYLKFKRRARP